MFTKNELLKMATLAAESFLEKNGAEDINAIVKTMADEHGMNREQVTRLCEMTNHAVNASLLKKEAYTTFDLADPDRVMEKQASYYDIFPTLGNFEDDGDELDKVAESERSYNDMFADLVEEYGVSIERGKTKDQDDRFMKSAAEKLYLTLADSLAISKIAIENAMEDIFQEVKQSILEGVPLTQIRDDLEQSGHRNAFASVYPRLVAEGLVPVEPKDDDGPYSMERAYKMAEAKHISKTAKEGFSINEDAPLFRACNELSKLAHILTEDMSTVEYLENAFDLDSRAAKEGREKIADLLWGVKPLLNVAKPVGRVAGRLGVDAAGSAGRAVVGGTRKGLGWLSAEGVERGARGATAFRRTAGAGVTGLYSAEAGGAAKKVLGKKTVR